MAADYAAPDGNVLTPTSEHHAYYTACRSLVDKASGVETCYLLVLASATLSAVVTPVVGWANQTASMNTTSQCLCDGGYNADVVVYNSIYTNTRFASVPNAGIVSCVPITLVLDSARGLQLGHTH